MDLTGAYPNLSAVVDTGTGEVVATVFGSVNLASGPLCNSTPGCRRLHGGVRIAGTPYTTGPHGGIVTAANT